MIQRLDMQPLKGLEGAVHDALLHNRPILTHLNADTSWLLSIPYPGNASRPKGRCLFHILIDPWLQGPQKDLASWFSQQWHVVASSVQTIAELNFSLKCLENQLQGRPSTLMGQSNGASDESSEHHTSSHIDMVIVSHEFTDHCNRATLQEIAPDTPVFATEAAARLISSWHYFHYVDHIEGFSNRDSNWGTKLSSTLPSWLGISRVTSRRDALHFHSAVLVTFGAQSDSTDGSVEGVIYTPHGILADDLKMLSLASPRLKILVLLHGLHDIRLSVKQLNLGAHNALRAQRICGARYWVSTRKLSPYAGEAVFHVNSVQMMKSRKPEAWSIAF